MSAMPWLDELCQAKQAEIDRLRAENEALYRSHKDLAHKLADAGREIVRLRVTSAHWEEQYNRVFSDMDRLRSAIETCSGSCHSILATTAYYQPADDQEVKKSS